MSVFTVFFCGTGSNSADHANPNYLSGEVVSTLARNHLGIEYDDWIIVDGPGSGNHQEDDKWAQPGNYSWGRGTATGAGWEENVKHALAVIKKQPSYQRTCMNNKEAGVLGREQAAARAAGHSLPVNFGGGVNPDRKVTPQALHEVRSRVMNRPLPTMVNLIGWSRGAVTCHMMANAMMADAALSGIPVNIFAVDPVPGLGNFQHTRTSLASNVRNYFGTYARDEMSLGFSAVVPTLAAGTRSTILPFPGRHATLAGNAFEDGASGGVPSLAPPGQVVRHLAEKFLVHHGTRLGNTLSFSNIQLLIFYERMLARNNAYVRMRDESYTKAKYTSHWIFKGGERQVGVGGNWTSSNLSVATVSGQGRRGFVNAHHEAVWNVVFGANAARAHMTAAQFRIVRLLPLTAAAVL